MENTQSRKLGAGIIIISIIQFIGVIFSVVGSILLFSSKDAIINKLQENGQNINILSNTQIIISLIFQLIIAVAIILILVKKSIGIYSYFTVVSINIIYSIIRAGFQWTIIFSLIFPILMAIFINKKKKIFNI
jgi:hypothetical protein